MICPACEGAGGFVQFERGRPRFSDCVLCQGVGAAKRTGPRTITMHPLDLAKYAKHRAKMERLKQKENNQ